MVCTKCTCTEHLAKACKKGVVNFKAENGKSLCFRYGKNDHAAKKCSVKSAQCNTCKLRGHCTVVCEVATKYRKRKDSAKITCRDCNKYGHSC